MLGERGSLHLRDAAGMLGVSEMTVRRDVTAGSEMFTYLGGHLVAADGMTTAARYALSAEEKSHTAAKIAVCARAAEFIKDGDTIFIDCGSTTPHLAARIARGTRATVICYSLNVANILSRNAELRVVLLGGLWHPSSASFASVGSLAQLNELGINKAFISAAGVDLTRGVSCVQFHEVAIKQAAMARSVAKYLIVDASKFGQVRPAFFAATKDFDAVITDQSVRRNRAVDKALAERLIIA